MSSGRVLNFAAGPAAIPEPVLLKAQAEMLNWHNSGMSVMELSHRSKEFESIIGNAEADLRKLMNIGKNYRVLFFQGGGTLQFAVLPLNLLGSKDARADYIVTGSWSEKAAQEAAKYSSNVNVVSARSAAGFTSVPDKAALKLSDDAAYVYYCDNETVDGVEFPYVPDCKAPLVCDMSSNILSREVDVSKFGLIYAGAQKNIGPSGVTIVIVREDLLGKHFDFTPTMMNMKLMADNQSLYNTPPTFSIYMSGLVFEWMLQQGGVAYFEGLSQRKAQRIYGVVDSSQGFYSSPVDQACRSRMNITFRICNPKTGEKDEGLEKKFVAEAEAKGMHQLKGHRSVGGIRASVYNAVSEQAVEVLAAFMTEFRLANSQMS